MALHISNFSIFLPQYIGSTIFAILIYWVLGRSFRKRLSFLPRLKRIIGENPYFSSIVDKTPDSIDLIVSHLASGAGLFSPFYPNSTVISKITPTLLYHFNESGYPEKYYARFNTRLLRLKLYENPSVFQLYRVVMSILAWGGLLLLLTPTSYLGVFLPHLSTTLDIIISLALSISIFESSISAVYFFLGTTLQRILLVEMLVAGVFTISLVTPSMQWIFRFDFYSRLLIYSTILGMALFIVWILSQLGSRDNLFKSSFISGFIGYFFFIMVILFNILGLRVLYQL
ncbi:MAG TPA: hypothetical protein VKU79_05020 [Thermoplasmataceae archaeon]|nr:hypothetical protein [Thermoplasmataceae archaeon]